MHRSYSLVGSFGSRRVQVGDAPGGRGAGAVATNPGPPSQSVRGAKRRLSGVVRHRREVGGGPSASGGESAARADVEGGTGAFSCSRRPSSPQLLRRGPAALDHAAALVDQLTAHHVVTEVTVRTPGRSCSTVRSPPGRGSPRAISAHRTTTGYRGSPTGWTKAYRPEGQGRQRAPPRRPGRRAVGDRVAGGLDVGPQRLRRHQQPAAAPP